MNPRVTIITPTVGTQYVKKNIESVAAQTYKNIQHLVVIDGVKFEETFKLNNGELPPSLDLITLPKNTGYDGFNGHRIYGGCTFLAEGDYIMFLDEDNWIDPEHVESLVEIAEAYKWAYSLRKITDMEGNFICNDDCESLGDYLSVINDFFIDVNCFFLPKRIALMWAPIWYRRARHPDDQPEVDRLLSYLLRDAKIPSGGSGQYTVNYRAGNRSDSVRPEFFLQGNEIMMKKYNGDLPWRKRKT